ncbi:hypothetical protein RRF57_010797 [Xylaria bambusicola]|uniref:Uncharacterized protein n=1 Tax=Xylaria bambusicola TaxID=326684 RepID=A0AAN7ULS4_9PEZI
MEDAELEACEASLRDRDFARLEWALWLREDTADSCDVLLCKGAVWSFSILHPRSASRLAPLLLYCRSCDRQTDRQTPRRGWAKWQSQGRLEVPRYQVVSGTG